MASELPQEEVRSFSLGYPGAKYPQLPARDGVAHGSIERSNQFPNSSFFTHWISVHDSITWNVDVMGSGDFEVVLYYTCPKKDIGSSFELSLGDSRLIGKVTEAHDPALRGMEYDRVERSESYVKDFKPLKLGTFHLEKRSGQLTLKALGYSRLTSDGLQVIDVHKRDD